MDNTPYTYIFVRTDLSIPQQIVQAAHAALDAGNQFDQPHPTHMVLIGVNNQEQLIKIAQDLEMHEIKYTIFFEPDYDTGYTAIATEPITCVFRRQLLRKYKLLK